MYFSYLLCFASLAKDKDGDVFQQEDWGPTCFTFLDKEQEHPSVWHTVIENMQRSEPSIILSPKRQSSWNDSLA